MSAHPAVGSNVLILYPANVAVCGIGTWLEMLAETLVAAGHSVTVGLAWGARFHRPEIVKRARPQLKTVAMDARSGTEEARIRAIERTVLAVRPDVVILTCLDAGFAAVRRLRLQGHDFFRFIVTNHGNIPEQTARILEEQDLADLTVCVGRLAYEALRAVAGKDFTRRLRHIPNAVTDPALSWCLSGAGRLRVGYAGRLYDFKRTGDLVPFYRALVRLVPSAELWVAGEGPHVADLSSLQDELPGRVRYWGAVSRERLYGEFYPQIDLLAHFSASEGFGLTIAEAMAHGVVPVTAAFSGSRREGLVIAGQNALVFPVGDVATAAHLAADLSRDPERWRRLSASGRQHIRDQFSREAFAVRWQDSLRWCLAEPIAAPARPAEYPGAARSARETLRRLLRRNLVHGGAGQEWPHYTVRDRELLRRIRDEMRQIEPG